MSPEPQYATIEEALAAVIAESEPGDVLVIHQPECESDEDDYTDEQCTCQPMTLTVGAQA